MLGVNVRGSMLVRGEGEGVLIVVCSWWLSLSWYTRGGLSLVGCP